MMKHIVALALSVQAPAASGGAGARPAVPFPEALEAAAVRMDRIDDISRRAVVLGNGDLNALLWNARGSLRMRVTKNDLWDARIDTSKDPPLLQMDLRRRTWQGGTRKPASWHDHPYPQPRCAAVVVLGSSRPGATEWQCIRAQGTSHEWRARDGRAVMAVAGKAGTSAGYRLELPAPKAGAAPTSLVLRLSGTAGAKYYVHVEDASGKEMLRTGWRETPRREQAISLPLSGKGAPRTLHLYVMSANGKKAENRYARIAFEGGAKPVEIDLTDVGVGPAMSAHLDVRRAVTRVQDADGAKTTVRALAGRNVFLITGPGEVSLEEVKAPQLPPARLGRTGEVRWLHMKMPGDVDYKGMEYALAVAASGERKAVSMVTSFDTDKDVLATAIALARETVGAEAAKLVSAHERAWETFWSAAGLELGDRFFQDAWYRNLYYMRCFCRADVRMPITLYAGLATDRTGWHGAPTLDYNIQQVFWPLFVCNQVDLVEPYVAYLEAFAPRGRWLARKTYGVEGLFYPVNIFGPEHLVSPADAKSTNARQIAYVPWSYGLGLTGWALQNVWLRYKYQPDAAYLARVYPLLRDGAEFYANVLEQCRDDATHKAEIGPSYNPEHGPFGSFNNPVDIAYFRFLLGAAGEAAGLLERDATLAARWARQLARVPDYETTPLGEATIVANWKGATADSVKVHNVACPTVPIFPAGQVSWFSPPADKKLFERTLRWIRHNGNNSHIMVNVARARMSFPEAYTATRAHFSKIATPNGLYAAWPGHGYYLAESWAFAGLTAELLLQSIGDVLRVFPAWPRDKDARFTSLRARGGFLVSAVQADGRVRRVRVTSTAGGPLRMLSPWPRCAARRNGKLQPLTPGARGIVTLDTTPGDEVTFEPESRE